MGAICLLFARGGVTYPVVEGKRRSLQQIPSRVDLRPTRNVVLLYKKSDSDFRSNFQDRLRTCLKLKYLWWQDVSRTFDSDPFKSFIFWLASPNSVCL